MQELFLYATILRGVGIVGGGLFIGLIILYATLSYADYAKKKEVELEQND